MTVNPTLTIALGENPSICQGQTSALLSYSSTTGAPDGYGIDFDAAANSAGLGDFSGWGLPASPISINVPWNIPTGVYNGTLTVSTNYPVCLSVGYPITITVTSTPSEPTGSAAQSFCESLNPTVANLTATGTTIQWYAASSGGTALATSTSLVNNTHYYAS